MAHNRPIMQRQQAFSSIILNLNYMLLQSMGHFNWENLKPDGQSCWLDTLQNLMYLQLLFNYLKFIFVMIPKFPNINKSNLLTIEN